MDNRTRLPPLDAKLVAGHKAAMSVFCGIAQLPEGSVRELAAIATDPDVRVLPCQLRVVPYVRSAKYVS